MGSALGGVNAMLLNQRFGTRAVHILGLQADFRAQIGPTPADIIQHLAESGSDWTEVAWTQWPNVPRFGPKSADIGQVGPESSKFGSNSTVFGPTSPNFGRIRPGSIDRPNLARIRSTFAGNRPTPGNEQVR